MIVTCRVRQYVLRLFGNADFGETALFWTCDIQLHCVFEYADLLVLYQLCFHGIVNMPCRIGGHLR